MKPPVISVSREQLEQMPISVLVELVLQQKDALEKLTSEIERLKQRPQLDSKTSSWPPSSDLIKRSEKAPLAPPANPQKRKPGRQPGHKGKSSKGFGRLVKEPSSHSDETPWLVKGVQEWLGVFASEKYTLFHAGEDRSRAQLEKILGKSFQGVLISDNYSVYNLGILV